MEALKALGLAHTTQVSEGSPTPASDVDWGHLSPQGHLGHTKLTLKLASQAVGGTDLTQAVS